MTSSGRDRRWTHRDWLLPWLQSAVALGGAAIDGAMVPAALCLLALVCVPLRSGPIAYRRSFGWLVLAGCAVWWATEALAASGGFRELVGIVGWCLLLLACVQLLSIGRGGSPVLVSWGAIGAMWAFSGHGIVSMASMAAVALLAIEDLRRKSAPPCGTWPSVVRWSISIAVMAMLVALAQSWSGRRFLSGRESWSEPASRIKGFSVVSRLGSFGASYQPDRDDLVALRVRTEKAPFLLKGMVHDLYSNGSWVASAGGKIAKPERMSMDFSQFCRDLSDRADPLAWASSPDTKMPVLFAPPGTGCVGIVADSLKISRQGVFRAPSEGMDRGWTWYGQDAADTVSTSTDLRVPRDLEGLLDSLWLEIHRGSTGSGSSATDRVDRLAEWFSRGFAYDLDVRLSKDLDPLRAFFRARRGYCEYFASGAVLLLRRSGIPARYATGLSDPEPVAGGSWWVYRQGGAHAWVEWKPDGGAWRAFDPTPADGRPRPDRSRWKMLTEIVSGWGGLAWHVLRDGNWREAVEAWKSTTESLPVWIWICAGGVVFATPIIWFLRRGRRSSVAVRAVMGAELLRAESILRRQGHVREPGETVGRFLGRLPSDVDPKARAILSIYQSHRWKPGGDTKPLSSDASN